MIGGSLSGIYLMMSGTTGYTMGGLGIFGVVNFISGGGDASGMYNAFIGIVILCNDWVYFDFLVLERYRRSST